MLPYGRQNIDEEDIKSVIEVLKSDYITTGPLVDKFEEAVCNYTGARFGVAVSNGTAALHTAAAAAEIGQGDEVIVPTITFAATANCVVYQRGIPIFADVSEDTLLINPEDIERKISPKTKAIICVDYAGQPCDYEKLSYIADKYNLILIADASHSLGAKYKNKNVGTLADLTTFSFHPVKNITTGEGGMVVTHNEKFFKRMKIFRNHGISVDARQREKSCSWAYEIHSLGWNYRITDFQCALGISQIKKLSTWIKKRNSLAAIYDEIFKDSSLIIPLKTSDGLYHARHLYVVKVYADRDKVFSEMRGRGVGVNVHYIPLHLQPFYKRTFHTKEGLCPIAEAVASQILTLPLFPLMDEKDVRYAAENLLEIAKSYAA